MNIWDFETKTIVAFINKDKEALEKLDKQFDFDKLNFDNEVELNKKLEVELKNKSLTAKELFELQTLKDSLVKKHNVVGSTLKQFVQQLKQPKQ